MIPAMLTCAAAAAGASAAEPHRILLQTKDSGSNNTGDLFVVTAASATLSMTGEQGSLRLDGLRPHTVWFADKPARTGGQLDTSEFFGQEFLQNGLPNSLHCTALHCTAAAP